MPQRVEDLRIKASKVLLPPAFLEEEMHTSESAAGTIHKARTEIVKILQGDDHRLLVVVGPCSIHDPDAAREYAGRLVKVSREFAPDILIVMRVYFEKPRTTVGWKGLINDPHLDESFRINDGLRLARRLLLDLGEMGMPAGTEFLDMIIPQYLAGLVSWGAIGARTTESQLHRQLVSGLSCPVGFKNGTSGNVQIAVEALQSAAASHTFLGHTKYGQSAIFVTAGNPDCHVILRGGRETTNYDSAAIESACKLLQQVDLRQQVMIDCSHANSRKDHRNQTTVCRAVIDQIKRGEQRIMGLMIESNLLAGAQRLDIGKPLVYGRSITDECIGWEETVDLLGELALAVRTTRRLIDSRG
ncbi:MAG: 3-deoxy-7-phosphoheptulonate synthase [Acidobacteriaceae bacterium]|nr:3-deoxy-7-phosphoheptulonate synthase [Acidobacteriaceae bacterium]